MATARIFTDGAGGLHYFVCSCIFLQPLWRKSVSSNCFWLKAVTT